MESQTVGIGDEVRAARKIVLDQTKLQPKGVFLGYTRAMTEATALATFLYRPSATR